MKFLELAHLSVGYGQGQLVLEDFSLTVSEGKFLSLLGPSGCGKTTILRTIMGFIQAESGRIRVNGKDYTNLPPHKRNFGLVYQNYALFPHMSVFDNVSFGLKMRKVHKEEIHQRVTHALSLVDLSKSINRLPDQLSGGQKQRVALARAIVIEPDLLMLDEPLSNLDAKLRMRMRAELRRLQETLKITTIYVTHDQLEALSLSDDIVVMNHGKIEQISTPREIYSHPETLFVSKFVGFDNHFTAKVIAVEKQKIILQTHDMQFVAKPQGKNWEPGNRVDVSFRPEMAILQREDGQNMIPGNILFRNFQGDIEYLVRTDLGEFTAIIPETSDVLDKGPMFIGVKPQNLIIHLCK